MPKFLTSLVRLVSAPLGSICLAARAEPRTEMEHKGALSFPLSAMFALPLHIQASIALISAQLCFSGWHILGSVSFDAGADPLIFCLYRLTLGTVLMHIYVRLCGMDVTIEPADYIRLCIVGCGSFVSTVATALSLKYMSPSMFSIFQPSVPCLVAGLSMASGMEPYNTMKVVGVLFAVSGALVAELWKGSKSDETAISTPTGIMFACLQVTSMAILLVAVKPLLNKYEPAVVTTMYFSVGTALMFLLCLAMITTFPASAFDFNGATMPWVALLYSSVMVGMVAFFALNWAGKLVSPTVATVYFTFQPVGTCALSALILGAAVTWPEVAGGVLIVCGLLLTTLAGGELPDGSSGKVCHAVDANINGTREYENKAMTQTVSSKMESGGAEGMLEMIVRTVYGRGRAENRYQPLRTEEWVRAAEEEGFADCVDIV